MWKLVPRRKGFVEQEGAGEIFGVKEWKSVNTVKIWSINEMAARAAHKDTYRHEYEGF
jgi:hypothetical protein